MDVYHELVRRVLGVEELEIDLAGHVPATPGPIVHTVHTTDPHRPLTLRVETGRDRLTVLITDYQGTPLWIRTFAIVDRLTV